MELEACSLMDSSSRGMSRPLVSIYTTVYNSVRTVEKSIASIAKQLRGLDYEIVVVDNYSSDGTYEKLVELSKYYPIHIHRYRCSRGLGRRVAAMLSHGKYLIYVDLDCIYTDTLRKLIEVHMSSVYRDSKCLDILICPKEILMKENFLDLNRSEDVELFARLAKRGLLYVLPSIKYVNKPARYELRETTNLTKLLPTFVSERRYVKGMFNYFRRELMNKLHYIVGSGATPSKFVQEEWFIWRKWRRTSLILIILRTVGFIIVFILAKMLGLKVAEHYKYLTNHLYCDFMALKHIALPQEINLSCNDILLPSIRSVVEHLHYVLRYISIKEFEKLWRLFHICRDLRKPVA